MNILITDYHCASNRGDAAILEGELAALRQEFPDAEFTVMTEYPDAARILHEVEVVEQKLPPFRASNLKKNFATLYTLLEAPLRANGIRTSPGDIIIDTLELQPYYDADLLISTGGHHITDIYMPNKIAVLAEWMLCKRLGTPVALYGHTLGPFEGTRWKPLIRQALNEVDLITTRESTSVNHLRKLGVDETPIHSLADAAFMMPIGEEGPQHRLLNTLGDEPLPSDIDLTDLAVSISVRQWSHFDRGDQDGYLSAVAETADWLIDERDATVFFTSTCTSLGSYHKDDRITAHETIEMMDHGDEKVELIVGEYTPYQLAAIYGEMDLHIGTRMHSNILAMLAGTPIVPLEYQFKTRGTMQLFDIENRIIEIDGLTADDLRRSVDDALANREELADKIKSKLPAIRSLSKESARQIREEISP